MMLSPKKIEESIAPKIGIKKLKTETAPTLLYFKSKVQSEKAAADKIAIYINNAEEAAVK